MALLGLILISVLQFEGISARGVNLYYSPGNDAILPCDDGSSSGTCSIDWLYNRYEGSATTHEVLNGNIRTDSPRAGRLRLYSNCSLAISNITAEDAGRYTCRRRGAAPEEDTLVSVNILTISPVPPDADPKRDGNVTLQCSLLTFSRRCGQRSIHWVDETGTVLLGKGVGYEFRRQTNCVSVLTVKRQSGHNRRYTCRFVQQNNVTTEAHYTPDFTGIPDNARNDTSVIIGAVVGAVVVLVAIAAVLLKCRRRAKVTDDLQKPTQPKVEPEGSLTYATVDHTNEKASKKTKAKEDERVTYSTVKTAVDSDPGSFYSYAA